MFRTGKAHTALSMDFMYHYCSFGDLMYRTVAV